MLYASKPMFRCRWGTTGRIPHRPVLLFLTTLSSNPYRVSRMKAYKRTNVLGAGTCMHIYLYAATHINASGHINMCICTCMCMCTCTAWAVCASAFCIPRSPEGLNSADPRDSVWFDKIWEEDPETHKSLFTTWQQETSAKRERVLDKIEDILNETRCAHATVCKGSDGRSVATKALLRHLRTVQVASELQRLRKSADSGGLSRGSQDDSRSHRGWSHHQGGGLRRACVPHFVRFFFFWLSVFFFASDPACGLVPSLV